MQDQRVGNLDPDRIVGRNFKLVPDIRGAENNPAVIRRLDHRIGVHVDRGVEDRPAELITVW